MTQSVHHKKAPTIHQVTCCLNFSQDKHKVLFILEKQWTAV